jgi:hypothetical protein
MRIMTQMGVFWQVWELTFWYFHPCRVDLKRNSRKTVLEFNRKTSPSERKTGPKAIDLSSEESLNRALNVF